MGYRSTGIVLQEKPSIGIEPTRLYDRSRYGNHLTLAGTAGYVQLPSGLWVLDLDGDSDYASKAIVNWRAKDYAGTIAAWFKSTSGAGTQILFSSADTSTAAVYYIQWGLWSNTLNIGQRNNDTSYSVTSTSAIQGDGIWHLGVLVSNGTAYSIYLDGIAESLNGTNNGDWFADTDNRDNITVGAVKWSSSASYFTGQIALVGVLNYALSAGQIKRILENQRHWFGV